MSLYKLSEIYMILADFMVKWTYIVVRLVIAVFIWTLSPEEYWSSVSMFDIEYNVII